jgi:uncharacterized protein
MTATDTERSHSAAGRAFQRAIHLYQHLSVHRAPRCRYYPSCSAYADEAIARYGAGRGSLLAIKRLLRCQPFGGHGFDPVPELERAPHPVREGVPS